MKDSIKLYIHPDGGDTFRNGYVNVVSQAFAIPDSLPENTSIAVGVLDNLKPILNENKASEIVIGDLINKICPDDIYRNLNHWRDCMSDDGVLKLHFVNLNAVAKGIQDGLLDLESSHFLLMGRNNEHKSFMDPFIFSGLCKGLGFKIASIVNQEYYSNFELNKHVKN